MLDKLGQLCYVYDLVGAALCQTLPMALLLVVPAHGKIMSPKISRHGNPMLGSAAQCSLLYKISKSIVISVEENLYDTMSVHISLLVYCNYNIFL